MREARKPLDPIHPFAIRFCIYCGHAFPSQRVRRALYCSRRCAMAEWRAVKMLEGTHGWVDGLFRRLHG